MKVDRALILAAGFGTRMGKIGKILPKVIWPVFNKSILELQVLYLNEMGIKKIYINLHFQSKEILDYCKQISAFNNVTFLIEDEILGVGGAIHNLAAQDEVKYEGNLLIVNADQFCFFDKQIWKKAFMELDGNCCSLFATQVHKKHKYNETRLNEDGALREILPMEKMEKQTGEYHLTYGGFGFINLSELDQVLGKSDFFKSIAPYKNKKVPMTVLPLDFEYWDFGTKERYFYQMFQLLDNSSSEFVRFLERHNVNDREGFYFKKGSVSGLMLDKKKMVGFVGKSFISYQNVFEEINKNESLL